MKKKDSILLSFIFLSINCMAKVDYSVVHVNEESGIEFTKITTDNDYVCMPKVIRHGSTVNWLSNRILDISIDGRQFAYLSARNNSTNIFIKDLDKQGSSMQRTNRQNILDFSYSPNGKYICFSERNGKYNEIYQTDSRTGYVCRQFTNNNKDFSPIYTLDMKNIFFSRQEAKGISIWSYNIANNFLSNYNKGMNPFPLRSEDMMLCTRINEQGKGEIWRINYTTGSEECLISDPNHSFSSPSLSPDGRWILLVGSSVLKKGNTFYANIDIFACHNDGTQLTQITYHAADDLSPVWSRDGKYIYFISQRGSSTGTANVWRMSFNY